MKKQIRLFVNGEEHDLHLEANRLLLQFLRDDIGLTGTKEGCSIGVCGACSVIIDGRVVSSCLTLAVACQGKHIETIEGLAKDGKLHPLQQAFIEYGGFQCGICTPGQIMAAKALLDENPKPTEDEVKEWMSGNLCRCTGYYKILESVMAVVNNKISPDFQFRKREQQAKSKASTSTSLSRRRIELCKRILAYHNGNEAIVTPECFNRVSPRRCLACCPR